MSLQRPVQSFDEKAVLAELERLRESIQVARRARQRTSDEFEAFVKGFRTPAAAPTAERAVATPRAPEVRQAAIAESISRPLQSPDPPSSAVVPANTDAVEVRTAAPLAPAQGRRSSNARLIGVLAVIAVIAVVFCQPYGQDISHRRHPRMPAATPSLQRGTRRRRLPGRRRWCPQSKLRIVSWSN